MPSFGVQIAQTVDGRRLLAREPSIAELRDAAPILAAAYGDPSNAVLMGHDAPFDAGEVIDHYEEIAEEGGHAFFLYEDDVLVGDADLRSFDPIARTAELAIMLLPGRAQGRGLGGTFARLVHAAAFRALGLEKIFVAILPTNHASQRMFARLGHQPDASDVARALVDDPSEVTMSITRERFEALHAEALAGACLDAPVARE